MSRQHLVTKFVCDQCGSLLDIADHKPKAAPHAEGEPTGAMMQETIVAIKPCWTCEAPRQSLFNIARQIVGMHTKGGAA